MYRNTQYKKSTSSPFYWVYVLFLFWLPVPLLHSSLFSEEIKRSEYLSIITAHTVFLLVESFRTPSPGSCFLIFLDDAACVVCFLAFVCSHSFPYPHFPWFCRHLKSTVGHEHSKEKVSVISFLCTSKQVPWKSCLMFQLLILALQSLLLLLPTFILE